MYPRYSFLARGQTIQTEYSVVGLLDAAKKTVGTTSIRNTLNTLPKTISVHNELVSLVTFCTLSAFVWF